MLASMVTARRPTRAEVTDVANAIYDGTDAIMLSEETAVGEHPVEAVRVMDRIARATEPDLPYGEWLFQPHRPGHPGRRRLGRPGRCRRRLPARAEGDRGADESGRTARLISAHRPNVPVLAVSPHIETVRRLCLLFGVTAVESRARRGTCASCSTDCAGLAAHHGIAEPGDLIAITATLPEQELGTNLFEIHRVPSSAIE